MRYLQTNTRDRKGFFLGTKKGLRKRSPNGFVTRQEREIWKPHSYRATKITQKLNFPMHRNKIKRKSELTELNRYRNETTKQTRSQFGSFTIQEKKRNPFSFNPYSSRRSARGTRIRLGTTSDFCSRAGAVDVYLRIQKQRKKDAWREMEERMARSQLLTERNKEKNVEMLQEGDRAKQNSSKRRWACSVGLGKCLHPSEVT